MHLIYYKHEVNCYLQSKDYLFLDLELTLRYIIYLINRKEEYQMTFTISEVAQRTGISAYTLRYYDKEGLLPFVDRDNIGIRRFKEDDFNWLRIIACLKNSGMPLKQIKEYVKLGMKGSSTTEERLEIMRKHKANVLMQMSELEENLNTINYKIDVYQERLRNEEKN